jgi:hypothetical protein
MRASDRQCESAAALRRAQVKAYYCRATPRVETRGIWYWEETDALEVGSSIYKLADSPETVLAHEIVPCVASSAKIL